MNIQIRGTAAVIISSILFVAWIAGVVLAKGFWLVLLSICFPFYSWYLVMEKIMQILGVIV